MKGAHADRDRALERRVTELLGDQGIGLSFDSRASEVGPVNYDRASDVNFADALERHGFDGDVALDSLLLGVAGEPRQGAMTAKD